jgi:hypothetical protein
MRLARSSLLGVSLVATSLVAAGCGGGQPPAPTAPAAPTTAPAPAASPAASPKPAVSPAASPSPSPAIAASPAVSPAAAASPSPAAQAAPKPDTVTLTITSPQAGETVSAGTVTVTIDYSGPDLVPAADATKLTDYHFHYFLDEDPTPYIGTTTPIPTGTPRIIHSAAKQVNFDNVTAGNHNLAVVMTGNNHVSTDPPVVERLTFTVR